MALMYANTCCASHNDLCPTRDRAALKLEHQDGGRNRAFGIFQATLTGFECDGFKIEARCVGPPAPKGICTLSIRDTRVKKAADGRKPDEERKRRQN